MSTPTSEYIVPEEPIDGEEASAKEKAEWAIPSPDAELKGEQKRAAASAKRAATNAKRQETRKRNKAARELELAAKLVQEEERDASIMNSEVSAIYERYNNSVDPEDDELLAPFPPDDLAILSLKFKEAIFTLLAFCHNAVDEVLEGAAKNDPQLERRHLIKVIYMLDHSCGVLGFIDFERQRYPENMESGQNYE